MMSCYQVTPDGRIVYASSSCGDYTVWGIGKYGFLHGAGAYLRRGDVEGCLIDLPTSEEMTRYFSLLDKFYDNET